MGNAQVPITENQVASGQAGDGFQEPESGVNATLVRYEGRLDDKSLMRREFHVRFGESRWGEFPGATRP